MYTVARSPRRSPKANVEPPGTPTPHCLAAGESGRAQSNSDFTTGLDNAWSKYTLLRLPSTGPLQKTTPSENSLLMMIISVVPGAALAEYGGIGVVNMGGPVGSAAGGLRPGVTGTSTALPSGAPAPSLLTAPPPLLLLLLLLLRLLLLLHRQLRPPPEGAAPRSHRHSSWACREGQAGGEAAATAAATGALAAVKHRLQLHSFQGLSLLQHHHRSEIGD
mmetsp:Transcript_71191/g.187821  ORF Transcript_71191/g.187821 Transcript_71191/m.187821 type:complete len:220 (+) Transcript_71191:846-1505(+)